MKGPDNKEPRAPVHRIIVTEEMECYGSRRDLKNGLCVGCERSPEEITAADHSGVYDVLDEPTDNISPRRS